jgi:hypothetical protein
MKLRNTSANRFMAVIGFVKNYKAKSAAVQE